MVFLCFLCLIRVEGTVHTATIVNGVKRDRICVRVAMRVAINQAIKLSHEHCRIQQLAEGEPLSCRQPCASTDFAQPGIWGCWRFLLACAVVFLGV